MKSQVQLMIVMIMLMPSTTVGGLVEVDHYTDKESWEAAVGDYTTLDFTGYEHGTPLDNQYEHLGVTFEGFVWFWNSTGFLNDEWGMRAVGGAWLHFETPMQWIAADHPGALAFDLYYEGELIYESGEFSFGGLGLFSGLVSSHPFDLVYLHNLPPGENIIFVDDLHFGVPAPGALGLLAIGALFYARRRRKGSDDERLGRLHRHFGNRHTNAA